jgi:hypothetical protein
MTSSVLDGGGSESPAPPGVSPLTVADPGAREPSVNVTLDNEQPSTSHDTSGADRLPAHASSKPQPNGSQNAHALLSPNNHTQPDLAAAGTLGVGDPMDLDGMTMDGAMDYTTGTGLDLYQQHPTQLLMALARLSAASQPQHMVLPPSTVRPSQVSLPHAMLDGPDALMQTPNAAHTAPPADTPLESFARIEFADSVFQMTTYAVIIGRDQRALEQARRDERRLDDYQRRVRENEQLGLPAPSPPTHDRGKFSKSYVSEEGGMLGPESDGEENPRPAKRRKTSGGAASASGDSHQQEAAAAAELAGQDDKNPTFNRQYVSHTPGAAAVNLSALRPSPLYVPFIGIHSPGPSIASRTKAISREHLKIEFNQKEGVFEAIPMHKNGFFCEDVHYKDEKVVLRSGDRLQIKDVDFVFIINGVTQGKTGAEEAVDEDGVSSRRYSEGGKEMTFEFESSHDPDRRSTSPEEVAAEAADEDSDSELSEPADDMAEPEAEETPEQEVMDTIEQDPDAPTPIKPETPLDLLGELPTIPKKRGPGRPPKNGIMSKREERLRKKAAMELAKKNMPQPPPGEPPIKRKVGRPRKHPLPENAPDRPEKRKYKPRKLKNGEEVAEGSEGEKIMKERRREKPKTPPLELNRDDYTEEQLQKPNKNYGVLIDEVLSVAPDGLTLKQIYKRIQMKYPFYYFTVDTKGWESSVRHNLIGNDAFKKNEETHLWSRVPGIDIDAGKKRKANSPDHSPSLHTFGQHYPSTTTPSPHMFHGEVGSQGYRPGSVPQRTGYPPSHGQVALGQLQQQHLGTQVVGAAAQQAPRQAYPNNAQVPGATPTAGFGDPAAARPSQGNAQATAYSSPYASRPPPTATIPGSMPGATRQSVPPHHALSPVNGLPRVDPSSAHAGAPGSVGARPAQPAAINGNTLPLKPAVAPELVRHVTNFKTTVTEQLSKRTTAAEAVAMSVINRGLRLTAESTVPDEEGLEKIVFGVFESSRQKLGANQSLHAGLVQALVNFKTSMTKTLEPRMGKLNSERLILSAVDRVLGFADRSTMPGPESDRKQYDEAETVLIPAIKRVVTEHQRTLASVASAAAAPSAPRPGPAPSALAATPGSIPVPGKGHAPVPASAATTAYPATAPLNSTTKLAHTAPASAHPIPAPARPPVTAPGSALATKPVTMGAPAQQGLPAAIPAQTHSRIPAAPTSQATAQIPGLATVQAPAQAPGRTLSPAGAQVATPVPNPVTSQAATQPPARAPAPAAAQVPGSTPAQGPPPAATKAPIVPQTPSQSAPLLNPPASITPGTPALGTAPAKPQAPAQTSAPIASQGASPSAPALSTAPTTTQAPARLAAPVPTPAGTTSQVQAAPAAAPPIHAPLQLQLPPKPPAPVPAPALGPASATSQAQTTHAAPPTPQAMAQTPAKPAAPVANMAAVTTPAAAPPPTPPPATVTAGR